MDVRRFGPLITPEPHPAAGTNINGPSLLCVPDWVDDPLGRYYLYFADHKGDSIRLAVADEVTGPYEMIDGGAPRGQVTEPAHQLRDPAIHVEGDRVWLLYCIAGESGIALAEIVGI